VVARRGQERRASDAVGSRVAKARRRSSRVEVTGKVGFGSCYGQTAVRRRCRSGGLRLSCSNRRRNKALLASLVAQSSTSMRTRQGCSFTRRRVRGKPAETEASSRLGGESADRGGRRALQAGVTGGD